MALIFIINSKNDCNFGAQWKIQGQTSIFILSMLIEEHDYKIFKIQFCNSTISFRKHTHTV